MIAREFWLPINSHLDPPDPDGDSTVVLFAPTKQQLKWMTFLSDSRTSFDVNISERFRFTTVILVHSHNTGAWFPSEHEQNLLSSTLRNHQIVHLIHESIIID